MKQLWTSATMVGTLVTLTVVWGCGGAGPSDTLGTKVADPPDLPSIVALCQEDLYGLIGLASPATEIEVVRTEAVTWPSPSLGCPRPGRKYADIPVPGYRVFLEADGWMHEYHTDASGRVVYYPSVLVTHCRSDAASRLGIDVEAIELVGIEPVMWPNAALGCPEPGMDYTQSVVPGFRIVLMAGRPDEYHTDMGARYIYCPLDRAA